MKTDEQSFRTLLELLQTVVEAVDTELTEVPETVREKRLEIVWDLTAQRLGSTFACVLEAIYVLYADDPDMGFRWDNPTEKWVKQHRPQSHIDEIVPDSLRRTVDNESPEPDHLHDASDIDGYSPGDYVDDDDPAMFRSPWEPLVTY